VDVAENVHEVDVEFVVPAEDVEGLQELLTQSGAHDVEPVEEGGILPVIGVVVAAAIGISILANVVIKLRQAWQCGVIVDARVDIVQTKKDCDLPPGTVLVFTRDGVEHTLHEPAPVEVEHLLTAALA
jgi:hypothetical protein